MPTRRQFMRVGVASAAMLVATRWLHPTFAASPGRHLVLDAEAAAMVAALVPVVLAEALPSDATREARIRETVDAFDRAVSVLSPAVRREVEQLFSFLAFRPSRIAMAGLWRPLERSSPEAIATFLTRWRRSGLEIQRVAYQALTQLIQAAWFDNPGSWAAIGYPGPPALP